MPSLYIHPEQNIEFKLFLLDEKGKYIRWERSDVKRCILYGRCIPRTGNKGLSLCVTPINRNTCRETLSNSIADFINNRLVQAVGVSGRTVTLKPPSTKTGRPLLRDTSVFTLFLGGSMDGKYVRTTIPKSIDAYKKGYELVHSKKDIAEVYELMDVVMGTAAMIMGGPRAYTRTLSGRNKVTVARSKNVVSKFPGPNSSYKPYTGTWTNLIKTNNRIVTGKLEYTGVSNFWMAHPAMYSVMSGLSRQCLELWFDGKYAEVDEEIGINSVRRWLAKMAKKTKFSTKDKEELEEVLGWFKSYFHSRQVEKNPGAYPLNKYTYNMFLNLAKEDYCGGPISFRKRWLEGTSDPYGGRDYGFYGWCKGQDLSTRTKEFSNRPMSVGWGGLNGNRVSFGGHRH